MQVLYQMSVLQIFSLSLLLDFSFSLFFEHFDEIQFILFFFLMTILLES